MGKRSRESSSSPLSEDASISEIDGSSIDVNLGPSTKYTQLDNEGSAPTPATVMRCSLPPHREALEFQTYEEYEVHYLKEHTNRCASCSKNFPTAHFLGLHIEENHNALRESLQAQGEKTYGCFVEGCERKCSTPQKRRLHLIDKHGFPKFYNFRVVDTGIDKASSMLREAQRRRVSLSSATTESSGHRRRASSQAQPALGPGAFAAPKPSEGDSLSAHKNRLDKDKIHDLSDPVDLRAERDHRQRPGDAGSEEMDDLEKSLSALRFVPTSVVLRQSKKS